MGDTGQGRERSQARVRFQSGREPQLDPEGALKCKLCPNLSCLKARELCFAISKPVSYCL